MVVSPTEPPDYLDNEIYWLSDGFHRVQAAKQADLETIFADIREGTRRDAILFAVGANAEHGTRRTNEDKRRAIGRLLSDEEWSQWSDGEIARQCKVHQTFVSQLRRDLSQDKLKIKKPAKRKVKRGDSVYEMDTS